MKHRIKHLAAGLMLILSMAAVALPSQSAGAINVFEGSCGTSGSTNGSGDSNKKQFEGDGSNESGGSSSGICGAASSDEAPDIVKNIINTMLVVLGMIAVIMIVIGGIRYATSNGDSSQVKAAKDTILYAVVGLVVAIMSFAIVNFVVGRISGQ